MKICMQIKKNITKTRPLNPGGVVRVRVKARSTAPQTHCYNELGTWTGVRVPLPGKSYLSSCPGCQIQSITLNDPYVPILCSVSLVETFLRGNNVWRGTAHRKWTGKPYTWRSPRSRRQALLWARTWPMSSRAPQGCCKASGLHNNIGSAVADKATPSCVHHQVSLNTAFWTWLHYEFSMKL